MHDFMLAAIGGGLIGTAASLLLLFNGRIAGISGITGSLLFTKTKDVQWRWFFLAGLLVSGLLLMVVSPEVIQAPQNRSLLMMPVAGLIVGFGTRMGSGCTSGHGVCGLGRRSPRSVTATLTFMTLGIVTVFVMQNLIGGGA